MFHRIIVLLLIVSSLSCNCSRFAGCFQSYGNIACRSSQNSSRIWRFARLHINSCWSVTLRPFIFIIWQLALQIWCLSKVRTGDGWFWTFLEQSRYYRIIFMKTFYNVVSSIISCAKEAFALIVQKKITEWVQFFLPKLRKTAFCPRSIS